VVRREQRAVSTPETQHATTHDGPIIRFLAHKGGQWIEKKRLRVDSSDRFLVERVAMRYTRDEQMIFYDHQLQEILPQQCLRAATEDGTNTILMAGRELNPAMPASQNTDSGKRRLEESGRY